MSRIKRPKDWREICRETYYEEGQAMGRAIMYNRNREAELWEIVGPLELWPRWYLFAFATLYREDHIPEYNRQKSKRCSDKKAAAKRSSKLEETREAARRSIAHPKLKTGKDAGPETTP
jgi:hypothetical protein